MGTQWMNGIVRNNKKGFGGFHGSTNGNVDVCESQWKMYTIYNVEGGQSAKSGSFGFFDDYANDIPVDEKPMAFNYFLAFIPMLFCLVFNAYCCYKYGNSWTGAKYGKYDAVDNDPLEN